MTKRLVSFDNEKSDLGLPDDVQERMDARYSGIEATPHIGPNGNWWVGETDTGTPARGVDGRSVTITGSVATVDDLPQEGSPGEGYITDSDGHLHVWDGSGWTDVGEVRGPAGTTSFLELNDVPPTFPPSTHTHTKSQITDLEPISTFAIDGWIVKRTTSGNITVPTTPDTTSSAASKRYVDREVGKRALSSHTHTKSQINDLETISTAATVNHIVKRTTSGNITVPTTPNASTSAASKSYVDTEVGKRALSSHTHSEYVTTTQMEARTPEIRTVSSPDQATSPGVLYVVMED